MGSRAKTRKLPLAAMIFFVVAVSMLVFLWATTRIASADNGPANWQSFGIDATNTQATANAAANPRGSFEGAGEVTVYEDSVLVSSSSIDISAGIATIEEEERIAEEQRRIAGNGSDPEKDQPGPVPGGKFREAGVERLTAGGKNEEIYN